MILKYLVNLLHCSRNLVLTFLKLVIYPFNVYLPSSRANLCNWQLMRFMLLISEHMFLKHGLQYDSDTTVHQCHKCGFQTVRRHLFKEHMITHENPDHLCCKICGATCKSGYILRQHMIIKHKPKEFVCQYCGYKAAVKDVLQRHVFKVHTHPDYKPYQCGYCEFTSATSQNCRKHCQSRHRDMEVKWIKTAPTKPVYTKDSRPKPYFESTCYGNNWWAMLHVEDRVPEKTCEGIINLKCLFIYLT